MEWVALGRNRDRFGGLFDVFEPVLCDFVTIFDRFMADFDRFFRERFFVSHWDNLG
jgi:hypothetical protein